MKAYVKPDLFYENFELSHSVASCGTSVKMNASPENCTYDAGRISNWLEGNTIFANEGCNLNPDEGVFEQYCYQTGTEEFKLFAS